MVHYSFSSVIESYKALISRHFENPKLESNGYMYFVKSRGYNVGLGGLTPLLAWKSAVEHVQCM
jgi:hypothetical protein